MAKVTISMLQKAETDLPPRGFGGTGVARYLLADDRDPIHLHLHEIEPGKRLHIGPMASDCVGYVWEGAVTAGGKLLDMGSSLVVEHGGHLVLTAGAEGARLFTFVPSQADASGRAGGHVHGLPAAQVRMSVPNAHTGSTGGLHADSSCPTCEAWLHENSFPGMDEAEARAVAGKGIHCHSEDEVIVVIEGSVRLGIKLYGPGTALAIAADTLYGFTPGPEGMRFINFRPKAPSAIRFPDGREMDEIAYWKDLLGHPQAIDLAA